MYITVHFTYARKNSRMVIVSPILDDVPVRNFFAYFVNTKLAVCVFSFNEGM